MNISSDLIDSILVIGTYAFYLLAAIVLIILLVSLFDRHPRPKRKKNDEVDTKKP